MNQLTHFNLASSAHPCNKSLAIKIYRNLWNKRPMYLVEAWTKSHKVACICLHVPACARMCLHVPACTCLCRYVLACACMCLYVPACMCLHACACMCLHVLACACMCLHVPACACMCLHVLLCFKFCLFLTRNFQVKETVNQLSSNSESRLQDDRNGAVPIMAWNRVTGSTEGERLRVLRASPTPTFFWKC